MRPSRVPVDSTSVPLAVPLIQRKLATESPSRREAGGVAGVLPGIAHHAAASLALPRTQRTCTGCEEENTKPLQAESAPSHRRAPLDPRQEASLVLDVVGKGGGQPLPPSVRADMEGRFAADFSDVRIHTDVKAAKSAAAVSARAYTVGNEVVFDHGAFAPGSPEGKHTLAHELAHVQQQRKGPVSGTDTGSGVTVSHPSDSFEQEAEATAIRTLPGHQPATGNGTPPDGQAGETTTQRTFQRAPSVQSLVSRLTIGRQCDPSVEDCKPDPDTGTSEPPITDAAAIAGAPDPLSVPSAGSSPPGTDAGTNPSLTPHQVDLLRGVYGSQLNTDLVRINKDSILAADGVQRTIGNEINIPDETIADDTLIHEAAHCWQNQRGDHYIASSLGSQAWAWLTTGTRGSAYDYSDAAYRKVPFSNWNSEQQAKWIQDHGTLPPSVQGLLGYP
jgi:hypothetical protein